MFIKSHVHLWFFHSASFFLHEQNSQASIRVEVWLTQQDNWCSQKNVWHAFNKLGRQTGCLPARRSGAAANTAALKSRGRKSWINTVTMEPQCWRKSSPVVCSGRRMVFTRSNTPTHAHTHRHTCSLQWDVTSGPTKKFTTVEFYTEDSSLALYFLQLLCVSLMMHHRNLWQCLT